MSARKCVINYAIESIPESDNGFAGRNECWRGHKYVNTVSSSKTDCRKHMKTLSTLRQLCARKKKLAAVVCCLRHYEIVPYFATKSVEHCTYSSSSIIFLRDSLKWLDRLVMEMRECCWIEERFGTVLDIVYFGMMGRGGGNGEDTDNVCAVLFVYLCFCSCCCFCCRYLLCFGLHLRLCTNSPVLHNVVHRNRRCG